MPRNKPKTEAPQPDPILEALDKVASLMEQAAQEVRDVYNAMFDAAADLELTKVAASASRGRGKAAPVPAPEPEPEPEDEDGDDITVDEILEELDSDGLKELCEALGMTGLRSDKARKAAIVKADEARVIETYEDLFGDDGGDGEGDDDDDGEGDDDITLEDLQELGNELLKAGKRKELKALLAKVGSKTISTTPEEKYEALYDLLDAAVDALE